MPQRRPAPLPAAAVACAALVAGLLAAPASASPAAPSAAASALPSAPARADAPPAPTAQPDRPVSRLVVGMSGGGAVTPSGASAAARTRGVAAAAPLRRTAGGAVVVALSEPVPLAEAARAARARAARADVVWAQPDRWVYPAATYTEPGAPAYPQWNVSDDTGYGARPEGLWQATQGSADVVVAVVDTGITSHPELAGRTVKGYDFVSLDELFPFQGLNRQPLTANDGNGRDADPSDPGTWITEAESTQPNFFKTCPATDSSWHGTHVAGIIAAEQGGSGVAGLAPGVRIQPVRAIGRCAGSESDIADAIVWASGGTVTGVPANATPADVINLSLGGDGACLPLLQSAITSARSRGAIVIAAAGNDNRSVDPGASSPGTYPADCDGVVSVAATGRTGDLGTFSAPDEPYSNYGLTAGAITLSAPGGDATSASAGIWSTINNGARRPVDPAYASYVGTSMAAAHVSAAAALLRSQDVDASLDGLSGTALSDATAASLGGLVQPFPVSSSCAGTTRCGAGILDLRRAPTQQVVAEPGTGSVAVSWVPVDGGIATGYDVWRSADGGAFDKVHTSAAGTTSWTDTGVADGTAYSYRVAASIDGSPTTLSYASPAVTPSADPVPGAPTDVAVSPLNGSTVERFRVTWGAPASGAAPTGYAVAFRRSGTSTWVCATGSADPCPAVDATSIDVSPWPAPLSAGTYQVRVTAVAGGVRGVTSRPARIDVAALRQSASISATTLRPRTDGYQDSLTVRLSSNLPAAAEVRVTRIGGPLVRTLTAAAATSHAIAWNGRTAGGAVVGFGDYRVEAFLDGRAGPARIATWTVKVRDEQVAAPSVSLSSPIAYWYPDGYQDTVTITSPTNALATQTWKLTNSTGSFTYRSWSFARTAKATAVFDGKAGSGARLSGGWYYLRVTAKGATGTAKTTVIRLGVSRKKLVAKPFSISVWPGATARTGLNGGAPELVNRTYDGVTHGELIVRGGFNASTASGSYDVVALSTAIPASVKPPTGVSVRTSVRRSPPGSNVLVHGYMATSSTYAGWFAKLLDEPAEGPLEVATGTIVCQKPLLATPAAAVAGNRVRWSLFNLATSSTSFVPVYRFQISGTVYVLS